MSLADLTGHLEDLASSQSGLRRSRAMAQLWSEIRRSDVDDRRAFALALADRFAPSLSAKFAEASGLDGPDFIRLVRSLIEMDGDDIGDVVSDLERLLDHPEAIADEITVAELIATADRMTEESGRDDLMETVFERLVDVVDDLEPVEAPLEIDTPGPEAAMPDVVALPVVAEPDPEVIDVLTPFDMALERMEDIDEGQTELPATFAEPRMLREPVTFGETERRMRPSDGVATDEVVPRRTASNGSDHRSAVAAAPDGWRRRRMISSLIRDGGVGVGEALALSQQLSRASDRRWVIGDLIERGLTLSERALLASRELPPNLRNRLETAGETKSVPTSHPNPS